MKKKQTELLETKNTMNKVKASLGGVNSKLETEDREIKFVHTETHRREKDWKELEKSVDD